MSAARSSAPDGASGSGTGGAAGQAGSGGGGTGSTSPDSGGGAPPSPTTPPSGGAATPASSGNPPSFTPPASGEKSASPPRGNSANAPGRTISADPPGRATRARIPAEASRRRLIRIDGSWPRSPRQKRIRAPGWTPHRAPAGALVPARASARWPAPAARRARPVDRGHGAERDRDDERLQTPRSGARRRSGGSRATGSLRANARSDAASPSPSTTGLIRAGRRGSRPCFGGWGCRPPSSWSASTWSEHPDLVASLEDEGFELGDHTFNHVDLTTMPGWEQHLQMSMTDTAIVGAAGVRPRFFRPPYSGGPESITRTNAAELASTVDPGHLIVLSNYDSEDWRRARCLADRAQRDPARAPGRRDPLPRRRRRSLADRRRAATPGAAPGAAGLSLRLALRAGRGAAGRDPAAGLGVGAPSGRAPDRRPRRRALDHGRHARAADPDRRPGGSPGAGGRRLRPAPRPPLAAPGLAAVHAAGLGDRPRLQRGGGDRARGEVAGGRRLPSARSGGRRRWLGRWHGRDRRGPRSAGGAGDPAAERGQGRGAERGAGGRVGRGDRHGRRRHRVRGRDPAPAGGAIRRPRGRGGGREHEGGQPPRPAGALAAHRLRDRIQPRPAPLRHAPLHADGSGRRRGVPAPGDRRRRRLLERDPGGGHGPDDRDRPRRLEGGLRRGRAWLDRDPGDALRSLAPALSMVLRDASGGLEAPLRPVAARARQGRAVAACPICCCSRSPCPSWRR